MKIANSIKDLKVCLTEAEQDNKGIGFVPTMGALYNGYLSLVQHRVKSNDVCIVNAFVNPTQFNNKHDLETYSHTLEVDYVLLGSADYDYVFTPSIEETYPELDIHIFGLGTISEVMEDARRPGHFDGVAQVVSKLFYIMEPDSAYFGGKGSQQIVVIRVMVRQLNISVTTSVCPIVHEGDGLTLSGWNTHLTPEQRQEAPLIARILKESTIFVPEKSVQEVIDYVVNMINSDPVMRVECYEIVDGNALESIKNWSDIDYPVGCIMVHCREVCLIGDVKY